MGVDQTSLDRIRNATFPSARRGYDKHEVESSSPDSPIGWRPEPVTNPAPDTVKRELERRPEDGRDPRPGGGQRAADPRRGRGGGSRDHRQCEPGAGADTLGGGAYSSETRGSADAYAKETRDAAEEDANATA